MFHHKHGTGLCFVRKQPDRITRFIWFTSSFLFPSLLRPSPLIVQLFIYISLPIPAVLTIGLSSTFVLPNLTWNSWHFGRPIKIYRCICFTPNRYIMYQYSFVLLSHIFMPSSCPFHHLLSSNLYMLCYNVLRGVSLLFKICMNPHIK